MILRAADELISTGGRNMLVKILKGSRDKKVLEHGLDKCPAYGFYHELTMEEISYRVDFMIEQDFIRIEYYDRLPVLVFSEKGWAIEEATYAEELYQRFCAQVKAGKGREDSIQPDSNMAEGAGPDSLIEQMNTVNRQVVFDVLEKIRASKNVDFIPVLEAWKAIAVRKVRERISSVEMSLTNQTGISPVVFRKARKGDCGDVTDIIHKTVRKVYPDYYPAEVADFFCMYYNRERTQADIQAGNVWVLLVDGRIIGTGSIEENNITSLYVLPEFQGKGYGTRMVGELEQQIGEKYGSVELDASLPSRFMYEKLGYHTIRHERIHLMKGVVLVNEVMGKQLVLTNGIDSSHSKQYEDVLIPGYSVYDVKKSSGDSL